MKSPQRSARWAPSTVQSATAELPSFGSQKRTDGPTYSIARAVTQSPTRSESCAKAPAIQNTPANASQSVMRVKFNRNARSSRPA